MKTFENQAAQGDVLFTRLGQLGAPKEIPADAVAQSADGPVIVAHSETQHHHAFPKDSGVTLYTTGDPLRCYLRIESQSDIDSGAVAAVLEHLRPFDTHEALGFTPGCYEVSRQQEYTPEGWRRVED